MGIIKSQPDLMENKFPEIIEIDARLEGFLERYDEEIIKIRPSAGKKPLSPFLEEKYIADRGKRLERIREFFASYPFINAGYKLEILPGKNITQPIFINQVAASNRKRINEKNSIIIGENSSATIVFDYTTTDEAEIIHSKVTEIQVANKGELNIIKIQRGNNHSLSLDYNRAEVHGRGKINWFTVETGSLESISSYHTVLKGSGSSGYLSSIYFADQEKDYDLNYTMELTGSNSLGQIDSRGVLKDKARKVFRGNLIFNRGAVKADGSEKETVLLLSPEARSETIPALYCGEEDVSGEHAASAGRISDHQLYYLMSRGLSLKEARKVLVEAALNPLIDRIPLLSVRETIKDEIQRRLYNE